MSDQTPERPAPEPPQPLTVLMGRVLADVPAVGKNSQAPSNMGGYAFRGIEDVLAALKPAMARHGVFCIPDVIERLPTERPLGSGKVMFVVDLCIRWTFYGPLGDTLTSTCWGQGTDMGDKATQKAMTSAFKSMLMQTFVIGDSATDAEAHDVPDTTHGPANWFKTNGWADEADHDLRRAEARGDAAALPAEVRSKIKDWMKSVNLTFEAAWTRAEVDELIRRTKELAHVPSAPSQDDEKAPSLPQTPDSPSEAPAPAPAEKPKRTRQPAPPVTCAWCGLTIEDEAALPVTFEGKPRFMHSRCHMEVQAEAAAPGGEPF